MGNVSRALIYVTCSARKCKFLFMGLYWLFFSLPPDIMGRSDYIFALISV